MCYTGIILSLHLPAEDLYTVAPNVFLIMHIDKVYGDATRHKDPLLQTPTLFIAENVNKKEIRMKSLASIKYLTHLASIKYLTHFTKVRRHYTRPITPLRGSVSEYPSV